MHFWIDDEMIELYSFIKSVLSMGCAVIQVFLKNQLLTIKVAFHFP
jgi:hypothetical protein